VDRYVELGQDSLDALPFRRLDEIAGRTLGRGENHRSWNGINGRQRENGRVIFQRGLMPIAMIRMVIVTIGVVVQAVRRHVPMNHDQLVSVVFAFMHVLGRSQRKQANRQAQDAREHLRSTHKAIL
jgi:hypothetical protein